MTTPKLSKKTMDEMARGCARLAERRSVKPAASAQLADPLPVAEDAVEIQSAASRKKRKKGADTTTPAANEPELDFTPASDTPAAQEAVDFDTLLG